MSGFDLEKILKQAKKLQSNLSKTSDDLEALQIEGQSGAGLVKVICNGRHDVVSVNIHPEALKQEKSVLEELIAAAVNNAIYKIDKKNQANILELAKGMNIDAIKINDTDEDENK